MAKSKVAQFVPVSLASFLILMHITETLLLTADEATGISYDIIDAVKYASFGLIPVLILAILKKDFWIHLFTILVILSFTPWVSFYNTTFSLVILGLDLDITSTLLLFMHLGFNPDAAMIFRASKANIAAKSKDGTEEFEASVRGFETRFRNKSVPKLEQIAEDHNYTSEAREAAKRLISRM